MSALNCIVIAMAHVCRANCVQIAFHGEEPGGAGRSWPIRARVSTANEIHQAGVSITQMKHFESSKRVTGIGFGIGIGIGPREQDPCTLIKLTWQTTPAMM